MSFSRDPKVKRTDGLVSASDLARIGYCERQVLFDAERGKLATQIQVEARARGNAAHASFEREAEIIAARSARRGKCFIASHVLGECDDTKALRAFRDLFLRRSRAGRFLVAMYYRWSPAWCVCLADRPKLTSAVRVGLHACSYLAARAVAVKVKRSS